MLKTLGIEDPTVEGIKLLMAEAQEAQVLRSGVEQETTSENLATLKKAVNVGMIPVYQDIDGPDTLSPSTLIPNGLKFQSPVSTDLPGGTDAHLVEIKSKDGRGFAGVSFAVDMRVPGFKPGDRIAVVQSQYMGQGHLMQQVSQPHVGGRVTYASGEIPLADQRTIFATMARELKPQGVNKAVENAEKMYKAVKSKYKKAFTPEQTAALAASYRDFFNRATTAGVDVGGKKDLRLKFDEFSHEDPHLARPKKKSQAQIDDDMGAVMKALYVFHSRVTGVISNAPGYIPPK